MSAPLSKGAERDARLLRRALKTAQRKRADFDLSPSLSTSQRARLEAIARLLKQAGDELAAICRGGASREHWTDQEGAAP